MQLFSHIVQSLEDNGFVFQSLLGSASPELVTWRPAPGKWNLLEIACHLRDEETEDFRRRVQQTLENPEVAPPSIDPQGWVMSRDYAGQEYGAVMQSFGDARRASVAYLRALQNPKWKNAWNHPKFGPHTASLFLHNWLAHDYLHIRQIIALKHAYLKQVSGEDLGYAGDW